MFPRLLCAGFLLLTALGISQSARAGIISTTGAVTVIAPPASIDTGALESDTVINVFAERQNITLSTAIQVDITSPGTSPSASSTNFSAGTIPVGTAISSFYEHFDKVGSNNNIAVLASGSITFDTDVLGLIVSAPKLNATDSFPALPGVTYGTDSGRDLEIVAGGAGTGNNDQITLSADRRTVTFNLRNGAGPDDVRIITAAAPEPASLAMLAVPALALLSRRASRRGRHELVEVKRYFPRFAMSLVC